jgi:hypothetical protein
MSVGKEMPTRFTRSETRVAGGTWYEGIDESSKKQVQIPADSENYTF